MHWSERIAEKIIEKNPNKDVYVCASGVSPSGSVHIGNFREIATPYFVAKALKNKGKKVRFIFSWDDFDRLRKVPVNVSNVVDGYEKYVGCPYTLIPNPFDDGAESYGRHFEIEFEKSLKELGIEVEYIYQSKEYQSGRYAKKVAYSLERRKDIYDILMSFKSQEAASSSGNTSTP